MCVPKKSLYRSIQTIAFFTFITTCISQNSGEVRTETDMYTWTTEMVTSPMRQDERTTLQETAQTTTQIPIPTVTVKNKTKNPQKARTNSIMVDNYQQNQSKRFFIAEDTPSSRMPDRDVKVDPKSDEIHTIRSQNPNPVSSEVTIPDGYQGFFISDPNIPQTTFPTTPDIVTTSLPVTNPILNINPTLTSNNIPQFPNNMKDINTEIKKLNPNITAAIEPKTDVVISDNINTNVDTKVYKHQTEALDNVMRTDHAVLDTTTEENIEPNTVVPEIAPKPGDDLNDVKAGAEGSNAMGVGGAEEFGVGGRIGFDEEGLEPEKTRTPKRPGKGKWPPLPAAATSSVARLRSWLSDRWLRSPAAFLVALRPEALRRARALWTGVASGALATDVLLVGYDLNGVSWLSKHNIHAETGPSMGTKSVTAALDKLIAKYKDTVPPSAPAAWGARALAAAARAAALLPYDSALLLPTADAPRDYAAARAARAALIGKRLKLYVVLFDLMEQNSDSMEGFHILQKLANDTEGGYVRYSALVKETTDAATGFRYPSLEGEPETGRQARVTNVANKIEKLAVLRDAAEHLTFPIPVDGGVRDLHVRIDGDLHRASLYPPNGPQIDLQNASSVMGFSPGSQLITTDPLQAVLILNHYYPSDDRRESTKSEMHNHLEASRKTAGVWRLNLRCNKCSLLVTARASIGLDAFLLAEDLLRIRVYGSLATVREATLVKENGAEIAKLAFRHQPTAGEEAVGDADTGVRSGSQSESVPGLIADVPVPANLDNDVHLQVVGRDAHGDSFVRMYGPLRHQTALQQLAEETRTGRSAAVTFDGPQANRRVMPAQSERITLFSGGSTGANVTTFNSQVSSQSGQLLSTVEIGLNTRLYGAPGESIQLHFQVSNYREQTVYFEFSAEGQQRFLRNIEPRKSWISPGQTVNVVVQLGITEGTAAGTIDRIVFTARGNDVLTMGVLVYVEQAITAAVPDTWAPEVGYNFEGDCLGKQGSNCAEYSWSTTITAHDPNGGLLRITSSPLGLRYGPTFIAGTRQRTTATYRATCCAPRLLVNAVDIYGNTNSFAIDISGYLTQATIAAIVLACLLFIAIIVFVGFLIAYCVRRHRDSKDLPYATSRRDVTT